MNHSRMNEEATIAEVVKDRPDILRECVDIGASTGPQWSNTWALFKQGWSGVLIECDPIKLIHLERFAHSDAPRAKVLPIKIAPATIVETLRTAGIDPHFGVLSLDIDGYDYHVLKALIEGGFTPSVICCEINPSVPPPYKFSVSHNPDYWWKEDTFFGMSLSAVDDLLKAHGYGLYALCSDNAIFVHGTETRRPLLDFWQEAKTTHIGYCQGVSAKLVSLPYGQGVEYIKDMWSKYEGQFAVWE